MKSATDILALLMIGLEPEISDFPADGKKIADTEPRPVSTSLAVAKRVEASEGPERAGNKPLMQNPRANIATPTGTLPATLFPKPDCPSCKGTGIIRIPMRHMHVRTDRCPMCYPEDYRQ